MRKIKVYVSIGLVGCRREAEIEVEDDTADAAIDEMAREVMFDMIEWGWKEVA